MVQLDTVVLGIFRSGADVAYYVAGSRLAALLLVPLLIATSALGSPDHRAVGRPPPS